jgi:hypothetical protein
MPFVPRSDDEHDPQGRGRRSALPGRKPVAVATGRHRHHGDHNNNGNRLPHERDAAYVRHPVHIRHRPVG